MKRTRIALLVLVFAGFASVFGQAREDVVTVRVIPPDEGFAPGKTASVILELTVRPPFHINSHQPAEEDLIPTTVNFKPHPGVTYGGPKFPRPLTRRLSFSDTPLSVFEGVVKIAADVTVAADFSDPGWVIEGTVGYQACDDTACLPPADAGFSLAAAVAGGMKPQTAPSQAPAETPAQPTVSAAVASTEPPAEKPKAAEPAPKEPSPASSVAPSSAPSSPPASSPDAGKPAPFEGKGLPVIFVLVFLGGLALNLTPCVYPIIPITISYFGGQAEGKKGAVVLHAVMYVLGMAVTYSILGVIAAFTGGLFGAALSYPPVLIAIALIMAALALSMFDVYEFRMPAFLNKLAGGSQKGYLGTLLMGLTVGIVAAPCIGPFVLGLLTYVGNRGNVLLGFSLFFVLALGLGVPFLILGIFSGSLNKLPRSGAWMVWVRKIFGFILLAMAAYFLKTLFPNVLYYQLTLALIMLLGGIYMGWIEPTKTAGKAFPAVRVLIGILFLVLALLFSVQGVEQYVDETIAARVSGSAAGPAAGVIAWRPYSDEALAEALASGRPAFIDSCADWCIPCKELDKMTFSRPEIIAASRSFAMFKADLTVGTSDKVRAFYKRFAVRGVPTLLFLRPDGTEIAELRGTGFEPADAFLSKMNAALKQSGLK